MKYINLIDKLTREEIATLELYITKFGASDKFRHISVEEWLEQWSHSNQKLYRLLGNSFIYKIPFKYTKPRPEIRNEMVKFVGNSEFKACYHDFYVSFVKEKQDVFAFSNEDVFFFNRLMDISNFVDNTIAYGIKYKKPNGKKMLQIQEGTKPLKAIYRVMEYFKDDWDWSQATKAFEDFKKKFGIITSNKETQGTFCISIHPMDYITMSDNASNWESCMSWKNDGCYRVGTIEMMNSNNVLCCYLENENTPFVFDEETTNPNTGELVGVWNNKKWRQLFYFTKDIIMGGKAYPYECKELTLKILSVIHDLAKQNLNYTYEYGPETYKDMQYVTSTSRMENQRMWAKSHSPKANIIWDTKGMYNDMLNDSRREYWCYRNKVAHTKVISVSGKANCICCNSSIIGDCYDDDYNDRYRNTGATICEDCLKEVTCDCCNSVYPTSKDGKIYITKDNKKLCSSCIKNFRICPCCNKPFNIDYHGMVLDEVYKNDALYEEWKNNGNKLNSKIEFMKRVYQSVKDMEDIEKESVVTDEITRFVSLDKLMVCDKCYYNTSIEEKMKAEAVIISEKKYSFSRLIYTTRLLPSGIGDDYRLSNMKVASFKDLGILDA